MRKGFSLIEVLLAIFLVVICAFIVAATMPIANRARAKASDLDKAMNLAQKELESIRGLGYPNITPQRLQANGLIDSTNAVAPNTFSFTKADTSNFDNPSHVLTGGTGSVLIEQLGMDFRRVTVTVTWKEKAKTRSFVVGSLIANL